MGRFYTCVFVSIKIKNKPSLVQLSLAEIVRHKKFGIKLTTQQEYLYLHTLRLATGLQAFYARCVGRIILECKLFNEPILLGASQ